MAVKQVLIPEKDSASYNQKIKMVIGCEIAYEVRIGSI
jgi:hypothetical protein